MKAGLQFIAPNHRLFASRVYDGFFEGLSLYIYIYFFFFSLLLTVHASPIPDPLGAGKKKNKRESFCGKLVICLEPFFVVLFFFFQTSYRDCKAEPKKTFPS